MSNINIYKYFQITVAEDLFGNLYYNQQGSVPITHDIMLDGIGFTLVQTNEDHLLILEDKLTWLKLKNIEIEQKLLNFASTKSLI
jgi:hypothetical protein